MKNRARERMLILGVFVDDSMCIGCGTCVGICAIGAIVVEETAVIDADVCDGCWSCFDVCPVGAILED